MTINRAAQKIMIVDEEAESSILRTVHRRLEEEGWLTVVVQPAPGRSVGEEFEAAALWDIEEQRPDAVVLGVRFGDHRDDRFKGLEILGEIVNRWPRLPVLMFTQYNQGPDRETAVRGSLKWDAPVDFIDKLAGTDGSAAVAAPHGSVVGAHFRRRRHCAGPDLADGIRGAGIRQPSG